MQGKELPKQEATGKSSVGVDVGKSFLDIHVLPSGQSLRLPNTQEGIRRLKRFLKGFDLGLVVLEATGKWHRAAHRSLCADGVPVAVVDPFKARMFAKASGILAKTDRLDAKLLARFAAVMSPAIRAPAPEALEELAELVTARSQAIEEQTALKNQLGETKGKFLTRQLKRRIERSCKDIAAIDAEILAGFRADPGLSARYDVLTSIPGFGFVTAATLITNLAELGSLNSKQAALLAGLAPIADDSGKRQGIRVIFGGRASVRRSLYLAAVSAARFNPSMKACYDHLIAKGKSAKLALIAVARKLVTLANTLVAQNRKWQPTSPKIP
jgi:transposase